MNKFQTQQKGQLGQLKVEQQALLKGYIVSKPTHECRYDLVIDDGTKLYKTQIKYADVENKGAYRIMLEKRNANNILRYTSNEIDLILVYIPQVDKIICLKPIHFHNKSMFSVRTKHTDSQRGIHSNMLEDFVW